MANWKRIEYKGIEWIVSDEGQVRTPEHSLTYEKMTNSGEVKTVTTTWGERNVALCVGYAGYVEAAVQLGGKRTRARVHRLVAKAFCENYSENLSVNHIDGNKQNNNAANLECISLADNTRHQWATGLADLRGEKQPNSKLTSKQVLYIRKMLAQGIAAHTLAVLCGVSSGCIDQIKSGKKWAHLKDEDSGES